MCMYVCIYKYIYSHYINILNSNIYSLTKRITLIICSPNILFRCLFTLLVGHLTEVSFDMWHLSLMSSLLSVLLERPSKKCSSKLNVAYEKQPR